MSLYHHLQRMRSVAEQLMDFATVALSNQDPASGEEDDAPCSRLMVAQAMENLIDQIALFDACLTRDTPFMKHFVSCLQGTEDDDTRGSQILEDLVIFFREKALRLPPSRQTPIEQEILLQFERSQSLEDPHSLAARWYWEFLPMLVQRDYGAAVGLARAGFTEYIRAVTSVPKDE